MVSGGRSGELYRGLVRAEQEDIWNLHLPPPVPAALPGLGLRLRSDPGQTPQTYRVSQSPGKVISAVRLTGTDYFSNKKSSLYQEGGGREEEHQAKSPPDSHRHPLRGLLASAQHSQPRGGSGPPTEVLEVEYSQANYINPIQLFRYLPSDH